MTFNPGSEDITCLRLSCKSFSLASKPVASKLFSLKALNYGKCKGPPSFVAANNWLNLRDLLLLLIVTLKYIHYVCEQLLNLQ